jgi:hypothetical protein
MKKSDLPIRWFMLCIACLMVTGLYYTADTPAALKPQLQQYMKSNSEQDNTEVCYELLFTLYSIPNVRADLLILSLYVC